jgi:hypothetical protein
MGSGARLYAIGLVPPEEREQNELLENLCRLTGGDFTPWDREKEKPASPPPPREPAKDQKKRPAPAPR